MDTTSLGTTLVLRSLSFDMYKKACTFSTWEVTNVLHFVSFNERLLNFGFTQEKKGLVLLKISISGVPMGQLMQMKFRPKKEV